jgi:DNA polymerase
MAIELSGEPRSNVPPVTPSPAVQLTSEDRRAALDAIAAEVRVCTRCRLSQTRINAVPGEGHPDTEVVLVGEGPGQHEDLQGRPFVGAAGSFLTQLVRSIGWQREEVFITNVVKCRPPGNRDPLPDEMAACSPYLQRQMDALDPALVVTLGRFSLQAFMPGARIGAVHGKAQPVDPGTGARNAHAYAMYHPAAAFRQQALRETLQLDITGIPAALQSARRARPPQPLPAQLVPSDPPEPPTPDPVIPKPVESAVHDLPRDRDRAHAPVTTVAEMSDDQLSLFR